MASAWVNVQMESMRNREAYSISPIAWVQHI
jgi:hypothetical protein